jgi:hypothetical protein
MDARSAPVGRGPRWPERDVVRIAEAGAPGWVAGTPVASTWHCRFPICRYS